MFFLGVMLEGGTGLAPKALWHVVSSLKVTVSLGAVSSVNNSLGVLLCLRYLFLVGFKGKNTLPAKW